MNIISFCFLFLTYVKKKRSVSMSLVRTGPGARNSVRPRSTAPPTTPFSFRDWVGRKYVEHMTPIGSAADDLPMHYSSKSMMGSAGRLLGRSFVAAMSDTQIRNAVAMGAGALMEIYSPGALTEISRRFHALRYGGGGTY